MFKYANKVLKTLMTRPSILRAPPLGRISKAFPGGSGDCSVPPLYRHHTLWVQIYLEVHTFLSASTLG